MENRRHGGMRRKKVCQFCSDNAEAPKRVTGTCAKHQRELTVAIKRARIMALLPYVAD